MYSGAVDASAAVRKTFSRKRGEKERRLHVGQVYIRLYALYARESVHACVCIYIYKYELAQSRRERERKKEREREGV